MNKKNKSNKDFPVFPNIIPSSIKESTFRIIESGDLTTEEDIDVLIKLLFQDPECSFYYFAEKDKGTKDVPLLKARKNGDILMQETEFFYYRHPKFKHDYVKIESRDNKYEWDWEEEVVGKGPMYTRTKLQISHRKRTELETLQKIEMESAMRKQRMAKSSNDVSSNSDGKLPAKPPEIFHRWFMLSIKIIIPGLITFLGLVVTLYSLSARVAVTSDSPISPEKPFSSPFTVSNQGILPIYNVLFSSTLRNVKWKDGGIVNIRTKTDAAPIKRINAGEATTTFCKFLPYKAKIESADIEVEINYRPAYLFWSRCSSIRFGTVKESNGTLRWLPKALSE
jgi:hypothetical protein